MNIINVTDYDNITNSDNTTLRKCTNNDDNDTNIEIVIPLITIKKLYYKWRNIYTQNILFAV